MTQAGPDLGPGAELDALIAEEVMKWREIEHAKLAEETGLPRETIAPFRVWITGSWNPIRITGPAGKGFTLGGVSLFPWSPSTKIQDAMGVVVTLANDHKIPLTIVSDPHDFGYVRVGFPHANWHDGLAESPSYGLSPGKDIFIAKGGFPLAISLAALACVRGQGGRS